MKKARLSKQISKNENKNVEENFSVKASIITGILMLGALVGFYFLTDKILENKKKEEENNQETISYNVRKDNDVNFSDIGNIKDKSYYLLIDKADDESNTMYDIYINSLKYSKYSTNFYYVDLGKEENKNLLDKKSNLKDFKDLKVSDTTLIYVNEGKIDKTYVGSEKIIEHLGTFFASAVESNSNSNKTDSNSNKESNSNKDSKSNSNKNTKSNKKK
jgi:hypothetical protein